MRLAHYVVERDDYAAEDAVVVDRLALLLLVEHQVQVVAVPEQRDEAVDVDHLELDLRELLRDQEPANVEERDVVDGLFKVEGLEQVDEPLHSCRKREWEKEEGGFFVEEQSASPFGNNNNIKRQYYLWQE